MRGYSVTPCSTGLRTCWQGSAASVRLQTHCTHTARRSGTKRHLQLLLPGYPLHEAVSATFRVQLPAARLTGRVCSDDSAVCVCTAAAPPSSYSFI